MSRSRQAQFPHLTGDLDESAGRALADLFKVLANDTRLQILHAVHRSGEITPSEIASVIGASPQTVSNHLQRLADQRIVHARRDGQHVLYRIIDPCVPGLMNLGVCLLNERDPAS